MAKNATKHVDTSKPRPALSITSKRESFRRLGRQFQRNEPVVIALDELDPEELKRVEDEGELNIERTEIAPEASAQA